MDDLRLEIEWLHTGEPDPLLRETTGILTIHAGTACLTRHEDTLVKTVRNGVLVSAYPLALWLASSWWRLNFEPLPGTGRQPDTAWRMAHELPSADHGYVWPHVVFASDGDSVTVWASQVDSPDQSANYLCSLAEPCIVPASTFQWRVGAFIDAVIQRLRSVSSSPSPLALLWALVQDDMAQPDAKAVRMLEAQLGYEPEECPESVMEHALRLQRQTGPAAMAELAPLYGHASGSGGLSELERLASTPGLDCKPQLPRLARAPSRQTAAPWQAGVDAAHQLREQTHAPKGPVKTGQLLELLGLSQKKAEAFQPAGRDRVALARTARAGGRVDFLPRKQHPIARRFEYARLVGELALSGLPSPGWLVESDLQTATQKRQRAFAAAFLCPIDALVEFLGEDFSDTAIEAAAQHFDVSEKTVVFQLANNGYRLSPMRSAHPYRLTH